MYHKIVIFGEIILITLSNVCVDQRPIWSSSLSSFTFYPGYGNEKLVLDCRIMPTNWPNFTISTYQIFNCSNCVWETNIVKIKHVPQHPAVSYNFSILWFLILTFLLHVWQEKLEQIKQIVSQLVRMKPWPFAMLKQLLTWSVHINIFVNNVVRQGIGFVLIIDKPRAYCYHWYKNHVLGSWYYWQR